MPKVKSASWTPRNGKMVKSGSKKPWRKSYQSAPTYRKRLAAMAKQAETKYTYTEVTNSLVYDTSAQLYYIPTPQTGTSEHQMIGNKCMITGIQCSFGISTNIDPATNPQYLSTTRVSLLWDTQPATNLYGYSTVQPWRDTVLESAHIGAPFSHQAPRRFKVLHDSMTILDATAGPRDTFKSFFVKFPIEFQAYDAVGAGQVPFSGQFRCLIASTDNGNNTLVSATFKTFFIDP